ncbi:hypothetical protein [Salinimicrobium sp. WS361]|uniref:hypothetical protein n=1 Tax=Salinimicrobium sp. WS361 TaxID=3425123 RepID=UPI003D6EEFE2
MSFLTTLKLAISQPATGACDVQGATGSLRPLKGNLQPVTGNIFSPNQHHKMLFLTL